MKIEFYYKSSGTVVTDEAEYAVLHGDVFVYNDGILEEAVSVGWRVPAYDAAYTEARDLATVLHRIHYSIESPSFDSLDPELGAEGDYRD